MSRGNAIVGFVCLAIIGGVAIWLNVLLDEQREIHRLEKEEIRQQMASSHAKRPATEKKPAPNPRIQWFEDARALEPGEWGPGDPGEKLAWRVIGRSELVIELGPGMRIGLVVPSGPKRPDPVRDICTGVSNLEQRMEPHGDVTQVLIVHDKRGSDEAVFAQVKALLARRGVPIVVVQQGLGAACAVHEVIVR